MKLSKLRANLGTGSDGRNTIGVPRGYPRARHPSAGFFCSVSSLIFPLLDRDLPARAGHCFIVSRRIFGDDPKPIARLGSSSYLVLGHIESDSGPMIVHCPACEKPMAVYGRAFRCEPCRQFICFFRSPDFIPTGNDDDTTAAAKRPPSLVRPISSCVPVYRENQQNHGQR